MCYILILYKYFKFPKFNFLYGYSKLNLEKTHNYFYTILNRIGNYSYVINISRTLIS